MANPAEEGNTLEITSAEENTNILKCDNLDAVLEFMARSNTAILSRQDEIKEKLIKLSSSHRPDHPPYASMIEKAITALNEEEGSSEEAISKFIEDNYPYLPYAHSNFLSHHLWKLIEKGEAVYIRRNRFRLKMPGEVVSYCSDSNLKKKRGRPRNMVKEGLCCDGDKAGNPIHIEEDNIIERLQFDEFVDQHQSQEENTVTLGRRKRGFTKGEISSRMLQTDFTEKENQVEMQFVEALVADDNRENESQTLLTENDETRVLVKPKLKCGVEGAQSHEHQHSITALENPAYTEKSIEVLTDQRNEANEVQLALDRGSDTLEDENQFTDKLNEVVFAQMELEGVKIEIIDEEQNEVVLAQMELQDVQNEIIHEEHQVCGRLADEQNEVDQSSAKREELQVKGIENEKQQPLHKLIGNEIIGEEDVQMLNDQCVAGNEAEIGHEVTKQESSEQIENEVQNGNLSEHVQFEELQNVVIEDRDRRLKQQNEVTEKESEQRVENEEIDEHKADITKHVQSQEIQIVEDRHKRHNEMTNEQKKFKEELLSMFDKILDVSDTAKCFEEKFQAHVSTLNSTFDSGSLLFSTDDICKLMHKSQAKLFKSMTGLRNDTFPPMVEEDNISNELTRCNSKRPADVEITKLLELWQKHDKQEKLCCESAIPKGQPELVGPASDQNQEISVSGMRQQVERIPEQLSKRKHQEMKMSECENTRSEPTDQGSLQEKEKSRETAAERKQKKLSRELKRLATTNEIIHKSDQKAFQESFRSRRRITEEILSPCPNLAVGNQANHDSGSESVQKVSSVQQPEVAVVCNEKKLSCSKPDPNNNNTKEQKKKSTKRTRSMDTEKDGLEVSPKSQKVKRSRSPPDPSSIVVALTVQPHKTEHKGRSPQIKRKQ